jgi:uncharacterized membrane protein
MLKEMSPETLYSVLSYFPFLCVIIYIVREDSEDIRFHSKQGVIIFLFYLASVFPLIGLLSLLAGLTLSIVGASKAYKGIKYKIPYIYDLSRKINF